MADDTDTANDIDSETAKVLPTETEEPKKRRGPRRKPSSEASGVESAVSGSAKPAAKRGRPKATGGDRAGTGDRRAKGAAPAHPVPAPVSETPDVVAPIDEMEDLLQLEHENRRLRKLLSEKLREENASLRKRLGLE